VHAFDASRIRVDPGHGVGARLEGRTDVELQDDVRGRVGRDDVHRTLSGVERPPLERMVVEARDHLVRLELVGRGGQLVGESLPAVGAAHLRRAGQDDRVAPDDLVQLDGAIDVRVAQKLRAVVRRRTVDAEIVQQPAVLFRLLGGPLEIG
jgi:hypothetical protein